MNSVCLIQFEDDAGVYSLISRLCNKIASKCSDQSPKSQKKLSAKMRSRSFELLLKKAQTEFPTSQSTEMSDLLSYYFILQQNIKNVIDYKRSLELKKIINILRESKFGDNSETLQVLKLLISLQDMVKLGSSEMFQAPFAFGILDQILPRLKREEYGSVEPYQYYPPYLFELPFSLENKVSILYGEKSQSYPNYALEVFESKSCLPTLNYSYSFEKNEKKSLMTPSIESWSDAKQLPYLEGNFLNFPRLTAPRDLQIPSLETNSLDLQVPILDKCFKVDVKGDSKANSIDIWEIASQIEKNLPDNIWEIVAKMPPVDERQLIATNTREVGLWRLTYNQVITDLCVISEKVFIRHLMYLIIGVETSSFPYCNESHCFYMKENLCLEGISKEYMGGYVSALLLTGTYFKRLYNFAFNQALDDHFNENGLIYEAAREVVRQFLIKFRLHATEIFEESYKHISDDINCMPTLLEILYHIEPLQYEMETVATIFKMTNPDPNTTIPRGAELMSYLFNEISLITNSSASNTLFSSLFSVCKVYFKFIERFIFEGELEDRYHEFFIRKDLQYVNSHSKKYWDKGFYISQSVSVPEFLKVLAKCILLCGKSLRLLKLCNPSDPLVVLISTNHPTVKCCWNLEELENQQQMLDVYRTRCLFVSGEPVTFRQILLKRDAEKKAFTEMASQKQAETMEKIMAERKRLAQLIIAEKQHSLRVLEAAIAETKAAKNKLKRQERLKTELELEAEKARDIVDSKLRDDEKNKMLAYYSKLNMEVEKSKIHTEWKIKRLQLDEARMQLLSSEERNLKREKLELEHQQNENYVPISVTSESSLGDENSKSDTILQNCAVNTTVQLNEKSELTENLSSVSDEMDVVTNKTSTKSVIKKRNSNEVFNFIYNAAKNIFGFKSDETSDATKCDNVNQCDAQGNIIFDSIEINTNKFQKKTVVESIKSDKEEKFTYSQFDISRREALVNKAKGMSHNVILTDLENNHTKISILDAENNLPVNSDIINEFDEAERNKMKVLGTELGNISTELKKKIYKPRTEAQREALLNKQKVLGVEYNLPAEINNLKVPANKAQEEALMNKQKVMGVEYNLPPEISNLKVPANEAQEEALMNKQKVMGVEYNLPAEISNLKMPANEAQEEALMNKQKAMGVEYNLPAEISNLKLPANKAQEEALVNKQKVMGVEYNLPAEINSLKVPANKAQEEALMNKQKVMGVEYNLPAEISNLKVPANKAQEEALMNKQKAMGVEYNLPAEIINLKLPVNKAQEEALVNKQKVMGVEYNLPAEINSLKGPANKAQEEALINKQKVMGVEYNLPAEIINLKLPANKAQEEALVNKQKVMGVEYNLPAEINSLKGPANKAQEEALMNKQKVMGVEYNLPAEINSLNVPANKAQEEALMNKQNVMGVEYNLPAEISNLKVPANKAQEEALMNKQKAMGVEYNLPAEISNLKVPANKAQEEALMNKQKAIGVEYNIPSDIIIKKIPITEAQETALLNKQKIMDVECSPAFDFIKRQPANDAQAEALRNRKRILDSDLNFVHDEIIKQMPAKRAGLTLDLKSVAESDINRRQFSITPNTGVVTPAEFFPRLDLETPTTAEAPFDGQTASEPYSPNHNGNKDQDSAHSKSDKSYLSPKGFNFSTLIPDDEEAESGDILDLQINTSTESSPTKTSLNATGMKDSLSMRALWNIKDEYNFENFDPFGIKELTCYSDDYFNKKMELNANNSYYTHPANLMKELQKSPHTNMFARYFTSKDGDDPKVTCDNIAILTACLQRSVMLPLTYQLEVVNNSILTYFLVDLDMYEHLKSLKDFFFLMDSEFSSTMCHNLFMKLNKTVNPQELLNFATLHRILNKSLGSSINRVNKFSENLSFTITEPPLSFHHSSPDVLQCLTLTYEIGWPLNIILSQEALMRYSKVFQFLVKMRRISWVLGQDFEELKFAIKVSKYPPKLQRSPQYICVQLYRHIMASLIRALDNYIVTTCILTSWTEFEDDLKKARTLDDLYEFHVIYIKKVLFRCLLNNRSTPVMKLLNDIFTVILKFSRVLRATPWQYNSGIFTHTNFTQLEELFHLFEKLAKYLHKVVTRLVECGYQRHLAELLSMVNLNSYYEPDKSKQYNSSI